VNGFSFDSGSLTCDGVRVSDIADAVGTPVYVCSAGTLRAAYRGLDAAFAPWPHTIHYALKANSTLALLRLLIGLGAEADANSGGELDVAMRAGLSPRQIVFTGVGKTRAELERAVALGVKAINVESAGEADRIGEIACALGTRARVAVRVNPDIDPHTHAHISTGRRANKFGIPVEHVAALLRDLAGRPDLQPVGVHVHLGSQLLEMEPLGEASRVLAGLARELRASGVTLEHIDLGGGLGVAYDGSASPSPQAYADAVLPAIRESGVHLLLEPGRALVANAGILVGRVTDIKAYPGSPRFVILDTGMTELIRPMLYGAFHRIAAVTPRPGASEPCEVVGPLCESSDTLGHDRLLGPVEVGDAVAVFDTGAYGIVMASNYNRRPMAAEVLVDNGQWRVVRRRQTIDDMLALEEH
jgi:diaminopimelate decarboxylase